MSKFAPNVIKYFSLLPLIISSVSDPVAWKVEAWIVNAPGQ